VRNKRPVEGLALAPALSRFIRATGDPRASCIYLSLSYRERTSNEIIKWFSLAGRLTSPPPVETSANYRHSNGRVHAGGRQLRRSLGGTSRRCSKRRRRRRRRRRKEEERSRGRMMKKRRPSWNTMGCCSSRRTVSFIISTLTDARRHMWNKTWLHEKDTSVSYLRWWRGGRKRLKMIIFLVFILTDGFIKILILVKNIF